MGKTYDVIIIGSGPAGLTAALYSSRSRLNTLVIEKASTGGQAATTEEIENWPGTEETTGPELTEKMYRHAQKFGTQFAKDDVQEVKADGFIKEVVGKNETYRGKSVILATGAEPRTLGIPGEDEFRGKGVSYCATCDADFFEELEVVVLGNGDAALEEAMYLTRFAEKVTVVVIHEEGKVDATPVVAERAFKNEKIEWIWNSTISAIEGDGLVEKVRVKNVNTGGETELETNGVFIFVGTIPLTGMVEGLVDLDDRGYVLADPQTMATNVEGVYAAGDCRQKFLFQVVTAAGDGATAAMAAEKYIHEEEGFRKGVLEAEGPVLVGFWSPADNKSMEKLKDMEEGVAAFSGKAALVKIDTYRNQRVARRYDVEEIPQGLFFLDGEVKKRLKADEITASRIEEELKNL